MHALRGIDLTVERGSIYGLIGPNGAGKSTVLRMLVDLIRPDSGEILVLGSAPQSANPTLRRRIGYLPGEVRFRERYDGRSLLERFASIGGPVPPGEIDALAERLDVQLERCEGLSDLVVRRCGTATSAEAGPTSIVVQVSGLLRDGIRGLIACISWGSKAVAGAEDSGRLEMILTHAVGRGRYALESLLALAIRVVVLCVVAATAILILNGPSDLGLAPSHIVITTTLNWLSYFPPTTGRMVIPRCRRAMPEAA